MKNSIYTTTAGMLTSIERLNTASNNLANVSTDGFKSDIPFEQTIRFLAEGPFPGKEQPVLGGTAIKMDHGMIVTTGRDLDLAIEGPGFFTIEGPGNQPLYTRNGSFNLNSNRELVTSEGYYVLDKFDKKITIFGQKMQITPGGDVMIDDNYFTTLKIVDLPDRDKIEKIGNTFFKTKENVDTPQPMETPAVQVGALEKSNVNLFDGLSELTRAQRSFDFQRTAADLMLKLLRRIITDVPRPI